MTSRHVLSATRQLLTMSADDFDILGQVSSGGSHTTIYCTTAGQTVGLGRSAQQLTIFAAELQGFVTPSSGGLTLGGAHRGSQTVNGIRAENSQNVAGIVILLGSYDNTRIILTGTTSTPNTLHVLADDGITLQAGVNTDVGVMEALRTQTLVIGTIMWNYSQE